MNAFASDDRVGPAHFDHGHTGLKFAIGGGEMGPSFVSLLGPVQPVKLMSPDTFDRSIRSSNRLGSALLP
jgi:hypothetical protein